ncbi:MAG: alpha/beta hydrolase family esterase [Acidimicrobiales bacterium]
MGADRYGLGFYELDNVMDWQLRRRAARHWWGISIVAVASLMGIGVLGTMAVGAAPVALSGTDVAQSIRAETLKDTTSASAPVVNPSAPDNQVAPSDTSVSWVTTNHPITFDGLSRSYIVLTPGKMTAPQKLPVIVVLHGSDASPQQEVQRTNFVNITGPAILVYPAGYEQSWNAGSCCGGAQAAGVNDVGFITAVLHQVLSAEPNADPSKVGLIGYSNGAKMALLLACEEPDIFNKVAVYGAVSAASCSNPGPVSLLESAGTADTELLIGPGGTPPLDNGFQEQSVVQQADDYLTADGCAPNEDTATVGLVTLSSWAQCNGGDRVELAVFQGADHDWPAGGSGTPAAGQVIWGFLASLGL